MKIRFFPSIQNSEKLTKADKPGGSRSYPSASCNPSSFGRRPPGIVLNGVSVKIVRKGCQPLRMKPSWPATHTSLG